LRLHRLLVAGVVLACLAALVAGVVLASLATPSTAEGLPFQFRASRAAVQPSNVLRVAGRLTNVGRHTAFGVRVLSARVVGTQLRTRLQLSFGQIPQGGAVIVPLSLRGRNPLKRGLYRLVLTGTYRSQRHAHQERPFVARLVLRLPPTPSQAGGTVIWNGDFSTGDLSQGWWSQTCPGPNPPKGLNIVTSPARPGYRYTAALTVANTSTHAHCQILGLHSAGPSAELISKSLFTPGMNVWIGMSVYLPVGFPRINVPFHPTGFFSLMSIYGPPYNGSPPWSLNVQDRRFGVNATTGGGGPNGPYAGAAWKSSTNESMTPITYGVWHDFVFHVKFATNKTGYLEIYYDGVKQKFGDGSKRIYLPTLRPGVNWDGSTPNHISLQQYRGSTAASGALTTYATAVKVARSYAAARP
jgi:hypothetical protein